VPIPKIKEIEIPLLHLINSLGGEIWPKDTYEPLADYFKLTKGEREEMLPNAPARKFENKIQWTRMRLVYKGFIDNSVRGIWKITEKGKKELAKWGLLNKPFPAHSIIYPKTTERRKPESDDLINRVINELLPNEVKKFPDDFLDSKEKIKFREINVPGTILQLDPYSRDTVVSPKGYFRYKAKNPPEALYIVYSNRVGKKTIEIPEENIIIFKAVKTYEKYIRNLEMEIFKKFLELTYDEFESETLTKKALEKLGLNISK